jgi:hypothetical protein
MDSRGSTQSSSVPSPANTLVPRPRAPFPAVPCSTTLPRGVVCLHFTLYTRRSDERACRSTSRRRRRQTRVNFDTGRTRCAPRVQINSTLSSQCVILSSRVASTDNCTTARRRRNRPLCLMALPTRRPSRHPLRPRIPGLPHQLRLLQLCQDARQRHRRRCSSESSHAIHSESSR